MKGVKHYTKQGKLHEGGMHKMPNGSLHSGKSHGKTSQKLFHFKELSKTAQTVAKNKKGQSILKKGLYANIHAKRKRIKAGSKETMRKVGTAGAPTAANFKQAKKTAKKPRSRTV